MLWLSFTYQSCNYVYAIPCWFHVFPKNGCCLSLADQLTALSGSSSSHVSIGGSRRNNIEKLGDGRPYNKKSGRRRINILDFNTDPLPSYSMDEEAVGIITMEDVMEELLQVEHILNGSPPWFTISIFISDIIIYL